MAKHSEFITKCCNFFGISFDRTSTRRQVKMVQSDGVSCGIFACFHAVNYFEPLGTSINCNPFDYRVTMAMTMLDHLRKEGKHPIPDYPTREAIRVRLDEIEVKKPSKKIV